MENKIEISSSKLSKRIYTLRGVQVMLDTDLAEIYQVETKGLKRAVKRNMERFPSDFMFEPTKEEFENLRNSLKTRTDVWCQFGTIRLNAKFQPYMPFAFTELGVAMLSSVLGSPRAIKLNIEIMRAFVQLRKQARAPQTNWNQRFEALENELGLPTPDSKKYDPANIIQTIVAEYFGLKVEDLISPQRTKAIRALSKPIESSSRGGGADVAIQDSVDCFSANPDFSRV